jgi:hypothetical protein
LLISPTGLGSSSALPQVSPGAIISLRSLLRFILSRSARYCVSTLSGLEPFFGLSPGFTWGYYLAPLVTSFQPLSGLGPSSALSPGFTWGYSHSTPTGLGSSSALPQVAPGAIHIISLRSLLRFNPFRVGALLRPFPRLHLGLFIFNPFRVGALLRPFPRLHLGLFIFNPFRVGALLRPFPRLHLGLFILSRSARYFVSTPIGVAPGFLKAIISLRPSPGCTRGYSKFQ